MSSRLRAVACALAFFAAAGCTDENAVRMGAPEPVREERLPGEAEAGLRALGGDAMAIERFTVVDAQRVGLTEYFYETRLYSVRFDATVRWTRDFRVRTADETQARQGAPDWTREEMLRDVLLRNVFGEGPHAAGATQAISAAAFFDDLEPGFRFRLVDKRFDPRSTTLRRGSRGSR